MNNETETPMTDKWGNAFRAARFNECFHLGLGDIRITSATQDDIESDMRRLERDRAMLREALEEHERLAQRMENEESFTATELSRLVGKLEEIRRVALANIKTADK